MELILIRHAEPIEEARSDGSPADPPLSDRGRAQARAVAGWLSFRGIDRILSSPALRARQTAEEMARRAGLEISIDDRLRDANAQADRYIPREVQKSRDPEAYRARLDEYRGSSRLAGIANRVAESLDAWTSLCRGERVAVFCHGSVINVYAARVLGLENRAFLEPDYASSHRFLVSEMGVRSLQSLNETAYLPS
ncbi:MAG: hypothetical protein CL933_17975 [Deltaproteobacteria bacterium]|nr:hypothetical protein [Deltaproteobacteria bacterium]